MLQHLLDPVRHPHRHKSGVNHFGIKMALYRLPARAFLGAAKFLDEIATYQVVGRVVKRQHSHRSNQRVQ